MYIKKIDFQNNILKDYSQIIDVRTPNEFNEDSIPTSINQPVLTNLQRKEIGKIYKEDPFKARNLGAQKVIQNINKILNRIKLNKSDNILIYCWRGGMRSSSLYMVLKSIGYNVAMLEKGYKSYRKYINNFFEEDIKTFNFNILSGLTGTGKTFFLNKMSKFFSVLDIENLAQHKGSILGNLPNIKQPSQKKFESQIWYCLVKSDFTKKVWVESESNRIGKLFLPNNLYKKMKEGKVYKIEMPIKNRINSIIKDYEYLIKDKRIVKKSLGVFKRFIPVSEMEKINSFLKNKDFKRFVEYLLKHHYDSVYKKRDIYKKASKIINLQSVNDKSFKFLLDSLKK